MERTTAALTRLADDDRVKRWGKTEDAHRAAARLYDLAETIRDAAWRLSGSPTEDELLERLAGYRAAMEADLRRFTGADL